MRPYSKSLEIALIKYEIDKAYDQAADNDSIHMTDLEV